MDFGNPKYPGKEGFFEELCVKNVTFVKSRFWSYCKQVAFCHWGVFRHSKVCCLTELISFDSTSTNLGDSPKQQSEPQAAQVLLA